MLEGLIKDINFVKGSKFEKKGKNLLVRNSDRTTLQENLEKYFTTKKIKFTRRKKPTELEIDGFHIKILKVEANRIDLIELKLL